MVAARGWRDDFLFWFRADLCVGTPHIAFSAALFASTAVVDLAPEKRFVTRLLKVLRHRDMVREFRQGSEPGCQTIDTGCGWSQTGHQ